MPNFLLDKINGQLMIKGVFKLRVYTEKPTINHLILIGLAIGGDISNRD